MVFLVVKGTKFPDEFIVECTTEDTFDTIPLDIPAPAPLTKEEISEMEEKKIPIKPPAQVALEHRRAVNDAVKLLELSHQGLAPLLSHLLNLRHYLRLMLLSAGDLEQEVSQKRGIFQSSPPSGSPSSSAGSRRQPTFSPSGVERRSPERLAIYRTFVEDTYVLLKDKTKCMPKEEFRKEIEERIKTLRGYTVFLFPEWCQPTVPPPPSALSSFSTSLQEETSSVAPSSTPFSTTDECEGPFTRSSKEDAQKEEGHAKQGQNTKTVALPSYIQKIVTASGAIVEEVVETMTDGEGRSSTSNSNSHDNAPSHNAHNTGFPSPLCMPWTKEQMDEVVSSLYSAYENPELNEDERLLVYHCRLILDDLWGEEDREWAGESGVWFSGKLMTGNVGKYGVSKSKFIVRIAPRKGPPPSGEPRIRYEDQRAIFQKIREKRETFLHLEESELRNRVVQQSRGRVMLTGGGGGSISSSGGIHLEEHVVRSNIGRRFPAKEVSEVTAE